MPKPNKLINELSPYLLQHAYNPVDWHPWGDEAFEKARTENKPIFLSIGYSTCHWCHVMEKESFEDEDVAKILNDNFISIKVDREERPDIDAIYMNICQMITGSGGWPLTIIMTPDKQAFFAGTYFPKNSRYNRAGLMQLLPKLAEIWKHQNEKVINSAHEISKSAVKASNFSSSAMLSLEILKQTFIELSSRFDEHNGGFGTYPKFPTPHILIFLLRYWKSSGDKHALEMVEKTLHKMRYGGIYDHIGFGFHRYSTDSNWLVPHFEKMLYDQALLSLAYTEAYQAAKNVFYKNTSEEILEYVNRDLKSPEGAFFSAEDADSEGEEGKFYLWFADEFERVLGEDSELFSTYFNLTLQGNWIDPLHGSQNGTNILHITKSKTEIAEKFQLSREELEKKLISNRYKLFHYREKRIHPFKDDKILTDWNSLMISAFTKAAQVFGSKKYLAIAHTCIEFILNKLVSADDELLHRYRNGQSGIHGNLDDYSFFISALLDFYESNFNVLYLKLAVKFQNDQLKYFWDESEGGFFFTSSKNNELLYRKKEIYDGAIPSGNSISLTNLIRLHKVTADSAYADKASEMIKAFSSYVMLSPSNFVNFFSGLNFYYGPSKEFLFVGGDETDWLKFSDQLNLNYIPNKAVIFLGDKNQFQLNEISKLTQSYKPSDEITAFICENFKCDLPIKSFEDFRKIVEQL